MVRESGTSVSVIDAKYKIDKTKKCKHDKGNIDTCGQRKEGSMFPFCAIGDVGENRCPQVILTLIQSFK